MSEYPKDVTEMWKNQLHLPTTINKSQTETTTPNVEENKNEYIANIGVLDKQACDALFKMIETKRSHSE